MFYILDNIDLKDIQLILIDDIGEKVYSANCDDEYELMMIAGHISNMLKKIDTKYTFSEIHFENLYLKTYKLEQFLLFFISKKNFDIKSNILINQVKEKIVEILEG
jgi:hypothetical protein